MRTDSLYQISIYFCIIMLIFSLSVSFVSAAGFYQTNVTSGPQLGDKSEEIVGNATKTNRSVSQKTEEEGLDLPSKLTFGNLWPPLLFGGGLSVIGVAWITRSPRVIGAFAFGLVFWSAYLNMNSIINIGGYMPGFGFTAIFHSGISLMFIGAMIGIFTGRV